ncbi:MAG: energy transducer TonB [Bacteroidales bacterium]|jgi:TonB family protein|nr:energy transducer TonB [Bacteroidales bacterium]
MKKVLFIIIFILSISHLTLLGQNTEEIKTGLNRSYKMEGETLLKEFIVELKPNQEKEYSFLLDKKALYAWHTYLAKKDQLEIKLVDSKKNLLFKNEKSDKAIIRFTSKNDHKQLYRLYFKNTSDETITTVVYLTYMDKTKAKEIEPVTNPTLNCLLDASKGTYLKDFQANLKPLEEERYSVVLSKNSIYELSVFQKKQGTFTIELLENKQEGKISPTITEHREFIESHQFTIRETGVYHILLKNVSEETESTVVLLNFLDKTTDIQKIKTHDKKDIEEETIYFQVDKMPQFDKKATKANSFEEFIVMNLSYPKDALKEKIEGKVFVQFTVDKNGYIKDAKVTRGVHPSLDQEALRIVYSMPKWEPGIKDKEPVDVILTFPVVFKL